MKVQNMTSGKIAPMLTAFALPLMAGNLFQELYTVVDTMIVGQFLGVTALAAVGNGGWITWMLLGAVQGFTQGFANPAAQAFGAGDKERVRKNMANSLVLTVIISVILVIIGEAAMIPLLKLLNTPEEIFEMSLLYLRIYYAGTPAIMAYNYAACYLRALGNSRDPLIAMIIASITNIVLDILFVGPMGMGIAGAVIATVIAQLVAAIYSFICLFKIDFVYLKWEDFRLDAQLSGNLIYMGVPMALQNVILSVGGLIVQRIVNRYGITFIAGMTATNRLYGMIETVGISYGYAISTFIGQNYGAGKTDRVKKGVRTGFVIGVSASVVIALIMILFGKNILMLFISGTAEEIAATMTVAYRYLVIMAALLPTLYCLHILKFTLIGLGNSLYPMLSGVAEFVMRVAAALFIPVYFGKMNVFFAEPVAWIGADIVMAIGYVVCMRKSGKNRCNI